MYNLRQIVHKSIYTQLNIYLHTHNLHEYTWMETKSSLKKRWVTSTWLVSIDWPTTFSDLEANRCFRSFCCVATRQSHCLSSDLEGKNDQAPASFIFPVEETCCFFCGNFSKRASNSHQTPVDVIWYDMLWNDMIWYDMIGICYIVWSYIHINAGFCYSAVMEIVVGSFQRNPSMVPSDVHFRHSRGSVLKITSFEGSGYLDLG